MSDTRSHENLVRVAGAASTTPEAPVRIGRGLRITLLSLAAAILLLGAAAAGVYGYVAISHGSAAAAAAART